MEAAGLGIFMISAGLFTTLLEYRGSPVNHLIGSALARRSLVGLAMGLTATALIYSPWGQQSGAHYNPAVTLTFFRLRKVRPWDAFYYVGAQFLGGLMGVLVVSAILRERFHQPPVSYVATLPGPHGPTVAFLAEGLISFGMMSTILIVSNTKKLARYTGLFAGLTVFTFITLEAPLSGMSMNPARSMASAAPAGDWASLWIYLTAPVLGMLLAADVNRLILGVSSVFCAKLNHETLRRCIFCASRNLPLLFLFEATAVLSGSRMSTGA
jgi:aquaporin Z